jgi:hypothetical protein
MPDRRLTESPPSELTGMSCRKLVSRRINAGMGGNTLIAAVEESSLSWLQKQLTCDEHDEHTCCNDQSALKDHAARATVDSHFMSPSNQD